ncbi:TonB-dependent receptor [Terriglobus tenax]|uniref:TonB-dependent receptor n=1 Tax=Terriglobus tenax TaxID=1111115 RepID=UPI0021DF68D2|nr:TonB-dependent receptor [Terriglobus tenax]
MRWIIRCTLAVLFASSLSLTSVAQTAQFQGRVTDPQQRVVPEAEVRIFNQATGVERKVKTNQTGLYTAPFIQPGVYQVYVQASGFSTVSSSPLTVSVGQTLVFDVQLKVGGTQQEVTVDSASPVMNTTDASVSTVVDRKFIENLPLNGRSFQDLISMTPGIVTQSPQSSSQVVGTGGDFSVNGQRTQSNYYTVDGVTANTGSGNGGGVGAAASGGALGGSTALGTTQTLISVDALQEFRVQSSTYSAEFGRSPGGQFSLGTRSGTNFLHGSAFDYLRNNVFDANDWFNAHYGKATPALRQNDFGGTVGGPVWIPHLYSGRSKSFFFASYEGLRLTQPTAATIQYVPDRFMRQQAVAAMRPILNAFPLPNGVDYGTAANPNLAQFITTFSLPSTINSTSVRIDHTLRPKVALFFRIGNTPSSTGARPYFARTTTSINAQSYTLGATVQFSDQLTNEFRLGYARSDSTQVGVLDTFGGATPIDLAGAMGAGAYPQAQPVITISIAGIGSPLMTPYNGRNSSRQWNAVNTVSLLKGVHALKFGFDYRHIKSPIAPPTVEPYAIFLSTQEVLSGVPSLPYVYNFVPATPLFHQAAVFAQDEWRLLPQLHLSGGLRWELNPPPTEQHGQDAYTLLGDINDPASLALAPRGTPLWKTTWYNFAPRLGLAWTAHDQPGAETVLRVGAGVFFDSANEVATLGYSGLGFRSFQLQSGAQIPFTANQLVVPIRVTGPYNSGTITAFPSHLQLPYTLQWNVSLQQALGKNQSFTVSYVAAEGRRLTGVQQKALAKLNPNFGTVQYFASGLTSNYQSLQVKFQRSVVKGVQALGSYTWSHTLDFGSNANALPLLRGNADFDVRNNLQGGVSWELPDVHGRRPVAIFLSNWGADARLSTRSAFPVTLGGALTTNVATGSQYAGGLNVVPGIPIYLYGAQYPGGRSINKAAFSLPVAGSAGDAPRNFVRGFGMTQVNLALRRDFQLHDGVVVHFRAETFNLLNHPNFGFVDSTYTDATFGQAMKMLNASLGTVASQYQQGGARSMQFALKLTF